MRSIMIVALAACLCLYDGSVLVAQQGQAPDVNSESGGVRLVFEVASVKPSGPASITFGPVAPDRFVRPLITVSLLLAYAYEVSEFQIQGGPDWTRQMRFNVDAKADGRPTPAQMRQMVRRLLEERFGLRTHTETRELPRYALVTARHDGRLGDKLRPSAIDCAAIIAARGPDYRAPTGPPQAGDPPRCALGFRTDSGTRTIVLNGISVSGFMRAIQPEVGRVIVDKTSLTGTYDIELQTEIPVAAGPTTLSGQPAVPRDGLSLFTALQEQLGLKLEPETGPVEVLVIDKVESPIPD